MWTLFPVEQDTPIHIRGLTPKGAPQRHPVNVTINARDFPDVSERQAEAVEIALRHNDAGYNVYTTINPVLSSFTGDDGLAVCDCDIACRRLLLIDIDRTGYPKKPATAGEIEEAGHVADRIVEYLSGKFDPPFRVMSGNGIHLYLPVGDILNDAASAQLCQQVLVGLGDKFDTDTLKVDRGVFNAGRITKFLGTIARKGDETLGRPFRLAHLL